MNRQVTVRHSMWSKRPGRRMEQHRSGPVQNTFNRGYYHKVSMVNENFCGKKIESDFLKNISKGGNHDEG